MEKQKVISIFQDAPGKTFTGQEVVGILKECYKPKRMSVYLDGMSAEDSENVMKIIEAVEYTTGLDFDEFNVGYRREPLVEARFLFVYMVRTRMSISLARIGQILGGRDHTTIIHAIKTADNWITNPIYYKRQYKLINDTARYLEPSTEGQA